jgi:hypothetical protein
MLEYRGKKTNLCPGVIVEGWPRIVQCFNVGFQHFGERTGLDEIFLGADF